MFSLLFRIIGKQRIKNDCSLWWPQRPLDFRIFHPLKKRLLTSIYCQFQPLAPRHHVYYATLGIESQLFLWKELRNDLLVLITLLATHNPQAPFVETKLLGCSRDKPGFKTIRHDVEHHLTISWVESGLFSQVEQFWF